MGAPPGRASYEVTASESGWYLIMASIFSGYYSGSAIGSLHDCDHVINFR